MLHMCAYMSPDGQKESDPVAIPDSMAELAQEYREKLLDEVVQIDEALMERYLEGEELDVHDVAAALKLGVTRGEIFPVGCAVATKNLGTHALLDLLVEGVPSPAKRGAPFEVEGAGTAAFVFKTIADPFAGKINLFRVLKGEVTTETTLVDHRDHSKERMGSLLQLQGKTTTPAKEFGEGDLGGVAKLKNVQTGDLLTDKEVAVEPPGFGFPEPVMSFAMTPKIKGEEEKVATAIKRLAEEDLTLRLRRDQQTGRGDPRRDEPDARRGRARRAKRRFGVDVELHQPRVPYLETIRKESRARHRYKKQTGGRGQFGDCEIVLEPIEGHQGYEFVDKIVGGVIPQSYRPAVDKGIQEAMQHGELAGAPIQGVRVRLVDGQYHNVDSSEMAFKIAGSMAFKEAYAKADPVLLEPIMELEVTVPDEAVGAVNGDLSSAARPSQRDGAGRRDDDDQGRGADGRAPDLLPVAHLDDRRPRRLRDAPAPLRAGPDPRRPEDRRRRRRPARRPRGALVPSVPRKRFCRDPAFGGHPLKAAASPPQLPPTPCTRLSTAVDSERRGYSGPSMRVTKANVTRTCAVCERTLLMGEHTLRFSPDGHEFVDVCPLCSDVALDHGWVREGHAVSPALQQHSRRRRQKTLWRALLGAREDETEPVVSEPILRRLSDDELALVEAADLFNQSTFRRTVAGVAKSLGDPKVSIVALPGVNAETVLTFAWDITWYQYRVTPDAAQPVRITDRGHDIAEVESTYARWNARFDETGRLVPELATV